MARPPLNTIVRHRFSRRDLTKAAPLAAVAAGVAGVAFWGAKNEPTVRTHGTCRFCLMHCGVTAEVQGSHLLKVEGNVASKTKGFLCEHGFALREMVHSHARLRRPLSSSCSSRGPKCPCASW